MTQELITSSIKGYESLYPWSHSCWIRLSTCVGIGSKKGFMYQMIYIPYSCMACRNCCLTGILCVTEFQWKKQKCGWIKNVMLDGNEFWFTLPGSYFKSSITGSSGEWEVLKKSIGVGSTHSLTPLTYIYWVPIYRCCEFPACILEHTLEGPADNCLFPRRTCCSSVAGHPLLCWAS